MLRRPASSPRSTVDKRSSTKSVVAPKAKATTAVAERQERHRLLLAKPAKVARPPQSISPTTHAGGKIYYSKAENCYRVKVRRSDRVDVKLRAPLVDKKAMRDMFHVACAMIEGDARP